MTVRMWYSLPLLFLAFCLFGCVSGTGKFIPNRIMVKEAGEDNDGMMELQDKQLVYIDGSGVEWLAPRGTLTDGASVPRLGLWVTDGRYKKEFLKAAVVHDAYCQKENATICQNQYKSRPWKQVHRMFYEACLTGGTSNLKAKIMYAAVYLAGPKWDDPKNELQGVPNEVLLSGFRDSESWIENSDPSPEEIDAWFDKRVPTLTMVARLGADNYFAIRAGSDGAALEAANAAEKILAKALDELPQDVMLLNMKGYHHQKVAENYMEFKIYDKVGGELVKAKKSFKDVLVLNPKEKSALSGVNNISTLQNDFIKIQNHDSIKVD